MAHSFRQVAVECNDPSATFEKQEVLLKALVGIQNAVCNNPATPPTGSPRMVLTVRNSCSLKAAVTVTAQGTNQAVQVHICEGRVADGLDGKMESSKFMGGSAVSLAVATVPKGLYTLVPVAVGHAGASASIAVALECTDPLATFELLL